MALHGHAEHNKTQIHLDWTRFGKVVFTLGGPAAKEHSRFDRPTTVAIDQHSHIFICDANNNRIQSFDADGSFRFTFGSGPGSAPGQFNNPFCVATDSKDHIIVTDVDNHRVQIFDHVGKFLSTYTSTQVVGGIWEPRGLVVNNNDRHIVVDGANDHSIQCFNLDGTLFSRFDAENGPFGGHKYVAVDKRNNHVFITDTERQVLRVFEEDGKLINTWPYQEPFDVAIAPDGHIIMIDNNSGMKVFDENFKFLHQHCKNLFHHSEKAAAMGIAVDQRDGSIIVAEATFHHIHKIGFYPQ